MKKTKFLPNKRDYNPNHDQYPVNDMPSMTVPDETLSLRQILDRHARQQGNMISQDGVYYGDEEMINAKTLDLAETEAHVTHLKNELDELNQKAKDRKDSIMRKREALQREQYAKKYHEEQLKKGKSEDASTNTP